jgi:two-component system, sporulation sensor kinase E
MIRTYFKAILDNSPESIVLIGKNHEVLAFNKTIKDVLYRYHHREIKEGDLYFPDFVIESNRALYLEAFHSALSGVPFFVENLTRIESTSIWFEYNMQPVYNEGELIGMTLSAKNITDRKEAELQVQELSDNLSAILDNTNESITLLDLDYKVISVNRAALNTIQQNTNSDGVIGKDFRNFVPDANNLFYTYYPKALKGEAASVEISYINVSGQSLWYQTKFNPVYDKANQLMGVSIFAKDITTSKNLEILLKESEERFQKITALAPVAIIITNDKFEIDYVNLFAKKIFGFTDSEFKGIVMADLIENFEVVDRNKIKVDSLEIETDNLFLSNERFIAVSKYQSRLSAILSSSVVVSRGKKQFIFVIQDTTDLNEKERKIQQQSRKLRDIAWHQSHVVRAPLARIMGLISLLEYDRSDEAERENILRSIQKSSLELDRAIRDIV